MEEARAQRRARAASPIWRPRSKRSTESIRPGASQIVLAGQTIRDHKAFYKLSVREALENSSNIGAIHLALAVGKNTFVKYVEGFGFAQATGIDLSGEPAGLMLPADRWSQSALGTAAMGQGIGVTAIQMLAAMSRNRIATVT